MTFKISWWSAGIAQVYSVLALNGGVEPLVTLRKNALEPAGLGDKELVAMAVYFLRLKSFSRINGGRVSMVAGRDAGGS